jgi:hypothetical protein
MKRITPTKVRSAIIQRMGGLMIIVIDLKAELAKLMMLRGRGPLDTAEAKKNAIVRLAPSRDGSIYASKFSAEAGSVTSRATKPWKSSLERRPCIC